MPLEIKLVPCLTDNYAVLVHDSASGETLCVDAPDARAIQTALGQAGWKLTTLLLTHHHHDHVEGMDLLKTHYGAKVYGPAAEKNAIAGLDVKLSEGDEISFAGHPIKIFETPGHTLDHICYYFPQDDLLFSADTLFVMGCGRIFEGTPAQMWASLSKLRALPPQTKVFCGHEYTLSNAEFSAKIEPNNIDLQTRLAEIRDKRSRNEPTVPTTIGMELKTNPFLRPESADIRSQLNMETASDEAVFTEIRKRKDQG